MKDISKYIESILDGVITGELKVVKDGDEYDITITRRNFSYHHAEKSFITLSNTVTVRRNLGIYFPNDDIKYKIKHKFV
jgi:hypothetical protein